MQQLTVKPKFRHIVLTLDEINQLIEDARFPPPISHPETGAGGYYGPGEVHAMEGALKRGDAVEQRILTRLVIQKRADEGINLKQWGSALQLISSGEPVNRLISESPFFIEVKAVYEAERTQSQVKRAA